MSHTLFTNLGALDHGPWQLTGAVTIYESTVKLTHVTISNNSCEDALNLIRSTFEINKLNINNTFADGFDGDFCEGTIENSYFFKTGNDGLDFSGSTVTAENVKMDDIGDKGISAGEQATLNINNCHINGAAIGLASKDLSQVNVKYIKLENCAQGFAAYRKKPEFGGARINVKKYDASNVKKITLIDSESKIVLPKS